MLQLDFQRYKIIITYFHALLYLNYGSSLTEFLFHYTYPCLMSVFSVPVGTGINLHGIGHWDYDLCEHSLFFFALLSSIIQ